MFPLPFPTISVNCFRVRIDTDLVDVANMAIRPAGCRVKPNDSVVHRGPFFVLPRVVSEDVIFLVPNGLVFSGTSDTIASLRLGPVLVVSVWIAVLVRISRNVGPDQVAKRISASKSVLPGGVFPACIDVLEILEGLRIEHVKLVLHLEKFVELAIFREFDAVSRSKGLLLELT